MRRLCVLCWNVAATSNTPSSKRTTRVLILTTYSTSVDVARAMKAGASGAFVKDADDDRLIEAIHKVAAGETAFSPEIESMLESEPHPPALTERQQNILEATSRGLSSEQIAAKLDISTYAVNQHIDAVRRKLGAQSRTEAVAIAIKKHLLKV